MNTHKKPIIIQLSTNEDDKVITQSEFVHNYFIDIFGSDIKKSDNVKEFEDLLQSIV